MSQSCHNRQKADYYRIYSSLVRKRSPVRIRLSAPQEKTANSLYLKGLAVLFFCFCRCTIRHNSARISTLSVVKKLSKSCLKFTLPTSALSKLHVQRILYEPFPTFLAFLPEDYIFWKSHQFLLLPTRVRT